MDSAPDFESGGWGFESLQDRFANQRSAIGLVVKYLVANEVPRVRFPDGAYLARVAQLVAPRSYVPMVQGSSPCRSTFYFFTGGGVGESWGPMHMVKSTPSRLTNKFYIVRSYHGESTGSHPNSEVKHHWACSVLRWGTTRESQVTNVFDVFWDPAAARAAHNAYRASGCIRAPRSGLQSYLLGLLAKIKCSICSYQLNL